jgi:hypothetical protein
LGQINSFLWGIAVSDDNSTGGPDAAPTRLHRALVLLAAVLFLEGAVLVAATGLLLFDLLTIVPDSYASAVAILVLTALAAAWVIVIGWGALHPAPWVRAAALTWQILQLAVAIGSFQGLFARNDVGWFLLVPAVVAILLLFSRPVIEATRRD